MAARSVAELIAQGTERLAAAGVDSPDFDASVLLASVLEVELRHLPATRHEAVSPDAERLFSAYVARRAEREPLQYITGDTEFYGLPFKCDARAMIPRPETETLVAAAIDCIRTLEVKPIIADLGTGTGIIAVALAYALPQARVYATDVSAEALALARENVQRHGLGARVTLLPPGRYLEPLARSGVADEVEVVVANPPYVETAQLEMLQPEISQFEPRLALDGGPDGLDFYRHLLPQCSALPRLSLLALEVGQGQADRVAKIIGEQFPSAQLKTVLDLAHIERVVLATI